MRGLPQACEEGATDNNGNQPWTEEDRSGSLATAEWIRTTFFSATGGSTRPRPKLRRIGDQLFTDDQLWKEFESPDPERCRLALESIDALANLAEVRARKRNSHFLVERHAVYDIALLSADIDGNDRELYDAAVRVWDEVTQLAALIDCEANDDEEWERSVVATEHGKSAVLRSSASDAGGDADEAHPR
ncbi:MAG: hypothetical protein ACKV2T_43325 [Kofleriaceae bacterium]